MQLSELDPVIFRKLTLHLVGEEQFHLDPAGSVLRAFDWSNRVITDEEGQLSPPHQQNAEIQQLAELTKANGIPAVATELKVGQGTLRAWVSGFYSPAKGNLEKIRSYLQTRETSPPDAVEQPAKSGELFTEPTAESTAKLSKLSGEPPA
jgi:hypothetical protein